MKKGVTVVRAALIAVLAALLVGAIVYGVYATRPAQYEARVGLVAAPRAATDQSAQAFGPVVSLTIPGVVDLVRSPSTMATVAREVPGAPSDLEKATTVGVVPGSGLVRITVQASTADIADRAVRAYQKVVLSAGLLGQVGELRSLGAPTVRKIAPDLPRGGGYALAGGVAAGLVVFGLLWLFGIDRDRRLRRGLVRAGVNRPIPVLHGLATDTLDRIDVLQLASARPVRVVPDVPSLGPTAGLLESALRRRGVPIAADGAESAAVVVVTSASGDGRAVAATASVVVGPATVVALVALHEDDPGADPAPSPELDGEPAPGPEVDEAEAGTEATADAGPLPTELGPRVGSSSESAAGES